MKPFSVITTEEQTTKTSEQLMQFDSTEVLISEISQGHMVVLLDDEDRENEGDLVMAARHVTPEAINFMARYGRGLICMPMTVERCERLQLPLMVKKNNAQFGTNFTVSIEAATGVTTGISAGDRARTIMQAAKAQATASDVVQPGHIFPLMAEQGGVLTRAGHTEAVCDLVQFAGMGDAGVLVEILNEDGTMARRAQLEAFAKQHQLKIGSIADLIHYRLAHEQTISRQSETTLTTQYGTFKTVVYQDILEENTHIALIKGHIQPDVPCLVRVHSTDMLTDVLAVSELQHAKWSFAQAMQALAQATCGVVVLLGQKEMPIDWINSIKSTQAVHNKTYSPAGADRQRVGIGCQILKDLKVKRMRLLTSHPNKYKLSGFGLEIVENVMP